MGETPDILKRILERKAAEVSYNSQALDEQSLRHEAGVVAPPRGFLQALRDEAAAGRPGVIAEIKKASPSKGLIRQDFDPEELALSYARGGATCLSVLTDRDFFQGHDLDLRAARGVCDLPVLRKDFIIDSFQVWESRVIGADCILLIVAVLSDQSLEQLYRLARSLGMDVLIEVHDEDELARAERIDSRLVGINNRNLATFEVSLETTRRLARLVPADRLIVAESGLFTPDDLADLARFGARCFLVGESLMRADDVAAATRALLSDPHTAPRGL